MSTRIEAGDTHNQLSLDALLAHIDERCRARVDEIREQAARQAQAIRRGARGHAAALLRETRERERRVAAERVRGERARLQARIRQRQLARQRQRAAVGLERVRDALRRIWDEAPGQRAWQARALGDARAVLPGDDWTVCHPEGWTPDANAERVAGDAAPGARLEWRADPSLDCGFVIRSGRARVDATIDGLTARAERIAGVLLAELPEPDSEVEA